MLEIVNVEAIPVKARIKPKEQEFGLAPYIHSHGRVEAKGKGRTLIRLETDTNTIGWGEMRTILSPETTKSIIENDIGPKVIGRTVDEIEAFRSGFFHEYSNLTAYIGGVEMAMWDAYGKALDTPLHSLLGGKCQDRIEYAYCLGILDPEESREHVRRALNAGFNVLKTKGGRDWKEDVTRIKAMHDESNGQMEFRLDPNQSYPVEDAVRVASLLEDAGIYLQYLEQPIRIDSFGNLKRLRNRVRTPIGVNEDMYSQHNLTHLGKEDAIDVAVADIIPAGGILGFKGIASIAQDLGVSLTHHTGWQLGIKTAAVLHTVSSTPSVDLPPDSIYYALADDIINSKFSFEDGTLEVPNEPGLGVTVNEEKVEQMGVM